MLINRRLFQIYFVNGWAKKHGCFVHANPRQHFEIQTKCYGFDDLPTRALAAPPFTESINSVKPAKATTVSVPRQERLQVFQTMAPAQARRL
jgi:hypothetical protein